MRPILELLEKHGGSVWSLNPDDSVYQALEMLADCNVGALMVMDGDKLVGIFSERDYTRKIALAGRSSKDTTKVLPCEEAGFLRLLNGRLQGFGN